MVSMVPTQKLTQESQVVPASCCRVPDCVTAANLTVVSSVWPGDCMQLSLEYVRDHALTLGIATVTVCCFLVR